MALLQIVPYRMSHVCCLIPTSFLWVPSVASVDNLGEQGPQALLCYWHHLWKHRSPLHLSLTPTPEIPPHFLICPVIWSPLYIEAEVCSSPFCTRLFMRFHQCYQKFQCLMSEKNSKDFTQRPLFLELTSESINEGKKTSLSIDSELSTHQSQAL